MTETQKRIRAYQKALPGMKERVSAVALLLVISISMMTSATFAWVTLSRAPEINGMATTVATNGNLEIALSDIDGLEPDETAVGDGGKPVTESNLTWGNLINLSDSSYGLDQLTLRPAILNSGSLLDSPLYSVEYGSDGRITELVSDFAFTNYDTIDGASAFFVPDETEYGVRAISSVTYSSVTGDAMLVGLSNDVARNQGYAIQKFQALYGNKGYMSSITGLAGVYLQYRMDDTDQDCTDYVEVLYKMMDEYKDTLLLVGDTLLSMANLHHFVYCNQNKQTYKAFNLTDLNTGTVKTTLAGYTDPKTGESVSVTLSAMDMYLSNYRTFFGTANNNYTDGLWPRYQENIYNVWSQGGSIGWEKLRDYINPFADLYSAEVNGSPAGTLGATDMASIAMASSKVCVLKNGLIKDMDKMLGTELSIKNVPMSALGFNITITEIKTDAESPYPIQEDVKATNRKAASGGLAATDAVAADTYGMAIDFWVRTNAPDSLLMLEGELQYQTVTLTDGEGNVLTDDEGNPITETKVVGYSGANRIWEEDDPNLPILGTSVTQGSGSCYIFYPESPEDQAQALEMLRAMCVAFVGTVEVEGGVEEGVLLAQADMDVDNAIEDGGRVLVPLQLRAKTIEVEDEEGNITTQNSYHIVELDQNVATKITAIVYMDGSRLENSQVLSSNSINGQLNIQFGTTEDMVSIDNPELKDDYYNIIISVADDELTYDPNNLPSTTVTLILNGMEANSVQANFVSYISETQGARQPAFTFINTPGTNEWVGEVTFNGPGSYHLRSVQIDGVDYLLTDEQVADTVVYIPGVGVSGVTCVGWNGNTYSYMTADNYYTLEMEMDLSIGQGISSPRSVQGVFAHEDGQNVTVNFTQTNNGWTAKTNFTTSGTYTMTYAIIDGTYVPLAPAQYKTLTLNLGMQARVFLSQPVTQEYLNDLAELNEEEEAAIAAVTGTDEEKEAAIADIKADYDARRSELLAELNGEDGLKMTISNSGYQFEYDGSEPLFMDVGVLVTDDKGNVMTNLSGVKLHYGIGASMVNRLDADLTFNSANNRYEGAQFQLTRPGTYTFQSLETSTGDINSASGAPKVAAIAKDPISYAGINDLYQREVTNITSTPTRLMSVDLADSPSAQVKLVLEHTERDEAGNKVLDANGEDTYTYTIEKMATPVDNLDGTYTYMVDVPEDGTWEIVGMYVSQAYYNGVYYDGETGEGATGWLDFSELVQKDDIITTFFTTVNFSIKNQPSSNQFEGEFMEDHIVEDLTITLTDYLGNAIEGADVSLSYVWNPVTCDFARVSGTPSNTEFSTVTTTDGKNFVMEDMNFQLDGQYEGNFIITIDGTEYSQTAFTRPDDTTVYTDYYVYWDTLPTLTIKAVDPAPGTTFSTTRTTGGATVEVSGVSNYISPEKDYAAVYMKGTKNTWGNWSYTVPTVTLQLEHAGIGDAQLTMVNAADTSVSHVFNFPYGTTETTQTIGKSVGTSGGHDTRYLAGTSTFTEIAMSYNGVTFSVKLTKPITISQLDAPYVLSFADVPMDIPEEDRPNSVTANGSEVTVYLPRLEWVETSTSGSATEWSSWEWNKDIRTDYSTYTQKVLWATYTRYDYYVWTEYKSTRTVSGSTTGQNMRIATWTINGVPYTAGKTYTITLDGNTVATPVISKVGDPYSMGDTTIPETRYQYGYVAGSTGQENAPSGGQSIGSAGGLNGAPAPKLYANGYAYADINGYEAAWP